MPYEKQVWADATRQDSTGARLNHMESGIATAQESAETAQATGEAAQARIRTSATAPAANATGDLWYDTTTATLRVWNGTQWRVESYPGATGSATTGGSVLQVVYASTSTQVFTTSTAVPQTTLIGLSAAITPRATTSRVLVMLNIQIRTIGTGSGAGIRVLRNGTAISPGDGQNYGMGYTNTSNTPSGRYGWAALDSPATTSVCTYVVYGSSYNANGVDFQDDNQYASTMTLMEIAG